MDNEVFNDYAKSRSVFVALKPGKPMEVFCSSDDYSLVSKYLNLHELMAVGNSQGRLGRGRLLCILGRRSEARLLSFVRSAFFHKAICHFFLPSGPNCSRKLHKSSASFSSLIPGNTILVPGIFALGSLMYSLKVASFQTIPEFLFASE